MHVKLLHHILNNTNEGKLTAYDILEEIIGEKNEEDFTRAWRALARLGKIDDKLVTDVKELSLHGRFDCGLAWACSNSMKRHGVCYMSPRVMVYVDERNHINVKDIDDREGCVVVYHTMNC